MANSSWHILPMAGEPSPVRDISGQRLGEGWIIGEMTYTFPAVKSHTHRRYALTEMAPLSMGGLQLSGHRFLGYG